MLSLRNKFLYIHVPKTGGNSIQTMLAKYSEDTIVHRNSIGKLKAEDGTQGLDVFNSSIGFLEPRHKHATVNEYFEKLGSKIDELFLFASVRNPYDRVISMTSFVRGPIQGKVKVSNLVFLPPQVESLKIQGKIHVQNFIRFENLQEDFDRICQKLSIPIQNLPHKNASQRNGNFMHHFDDESRRYVMNKYNEDFLQLGYIP